MSALAALELRKAIRATLLADAALSASAAAGRIYDEAPPEAETPYVALTAVASRDWSTSTESGAQHIVDVDVWSVHRGVHEALAIAKLVADALDDADLTLVGHALVLVRVQSIETSRERRGRFARARLRLRAITEALI